MSLWERRRQNPHTCQPSSTPPHVIAPPPPDPSSSYLDIDDLPSAELRGPVEDYIDRRGAWRAAQAAQNAGQSQSSSPPTEPINTDAPCSPPHRPYDVELAESLEDLRVTIMTEPGDTLLRRSASPGRFAFTVPSPAPSSGRHSTGTIRPQAVPLAHAEDPSHPTPLDQAMMDEFRYLESTIGFEDAIEAFAEATGFDLDTGMDIDEPETGMDVDDEIELQQTEVHHPQGTRRLSIQALEDAAQAMTRLTPSPPRRHSPPSRQSSHSRSYLDLEDTAPLSVDEWTARNLPLISSILASSATSSEPPQLPMLDIPRVSLNDVDFFGDLSLDSMSDAASEAPSELANRGLQRSATLAPRRPEPLDLSTQSPHQARIDNEKTPTGLRAPPVPAATSTPTPPAAPTANQLLASAPYPPASSHFRPNIFRKLSEPLLKRIDLRLRRNVFRSADLGKKPDRYFQLLGDQSTSALESSSDVGEGTTTREATRPSDSPEGSASDEGLETLPRTTRQPDAQVEPDDEDQLGTFGDILAKFPLPPQHEPLLPHKTPARVSVQSAGSSLATEERTPNTPDIVQTPSTQPALTRSTRPEPLSFADGAMHMLTASPSAPPPLEAVDNKVLRSPLPDSTRDSKRLKIRRRSSTSSSAGQTPAVRVVSKGKGKAKPTASISQGDPEPTQESATPREDYDKTLRPSAAQMKQLKEFDTMLKGGETVRLSARGRSGSGKGEGVRRGGFL